MSKFVKADQENSSLSGSRPKGYGTQTAESAKRGRKGGHQFYQQLSTSDAFADDSPESSHRVEGIEIKAMIEAWYPPVKDPPMILQDVDVTFQPGTITALMGSSGAGKTSLLNVLSGKALGTMVGEILLNDAPVVYGNIKHVCNFVPQDDLMYDQLSVQEALLFYAKLRLVQTPDGSRATDEYHHECVSELISRLGLDHVKNVKIGNCLDPGISGGQRKRVSVGMELMNRPSILFLDEPTSGLDSAIQEEIMEFIRELVAENMTIVCTIHAPSASVYMKFTNLLLLARNQGVLTGSMAFYGSTSESIQYFNDLGKPLPDFANPAEHVLDCINADYTPLTLPQFWRFRRLWVFYRSLPIISKDPGMQLQQLTGFLMSSSTSPDINAVKSFAGKILESDRSFKSFLEIFAKTSGCINLSQLGAFKLEDLYSSDTDMTPGRQLTLSIAEAADQFSDTKWLRKLQLEFAFRCEGHKGDIGVKDEADSQHEVFSVTRAEALDILKVMGFQQVLGKHMCEMMMDLLISASRQMPGANPSTIPDSIPYFRISRFLINFTSEMIPDDEMDYMADENFFFSLDTNADGVLSIDELAGGFNQLFLFDFQSTPLSYDQFKTMIVQPVHDLMLAGEGGDVTYHQYKTFMELRIALREHIKESAGTTPQNQEPISEKGGEVANITPPPTLPFWGQFSLLLRRFWMIWLKDPKGVRAQMVQGIAIPAILSLVYFDQDRTQGNYDNLVSCAFLTLLFAGMLPINVTVLAFPLERAVVTREYTNGCYDMLPFYLSKALFLCVSKGISSLLVGLAAYWLVGLHPKDPSFENFVEFMGIILISSCWGNVMGLTLGIIVDSADSAASVGMPVLLLNVLFSGFVITAGAMPVYFIFFYYLSFFHYALSGLLTAIFKDMEFSGCDSDHDESEDCPFGIDGDGEDVLEFYDIQFDTYQPNLWTAFVYLVVTFLAGIFALYSRLKINLVVKANVDTKGHKDKSDREDDPLEGFKIDYKSIKYLFGKSRLTIRSDAQLVQETEDGMTQRKSDIPRSKYWAKAVNSESLSQPAAERSRQRRGTTPIGWKPPARRKTLLYPSRKSLDKGSPAAAADLEVEPSEEASKGSEGVAAPETVAQRGESFLTNLSNSGPGSLPAAEVPKNVQVLQMVDNPIELKAAIRAWFPPVKNPPMILKDVNVTFEPGTMTALMGASGAGKTSLLNVLSGKALGTLVGEIILNDAPVEYSQMRSLCNFVPQDDLMYDALTVTEALKYYAQLRIVKDGSGNLATDTYHNALVSKLVKRLGLEYVKDVQIGNVLNPGISGGQRKRVSVGMELMDEPSLLFLDEPTTGLDSAIQEDIMEFIKELAVTGMTIVCTIHAPSALVYMKFNSLLLLGRNQGLDKGSMAFYGTTAESIQYFNDLGKPLPEYTNPAEHILECSNASYGVLTLPDFWKFHSLWVFYRSMPIFSKDLPAASSSPLVATDQLQQMTGFIMMTTMSSEIQVVRSFAERFMRSDRSFTSFLEIFALVSGCINLANLGDFTLENIHQRDVGDPLEEKRSPGKQLAVAIVQAAEQMSDTKWFRRLQSEFAFRCEGHKGNIGVKDEAESQHELFCVTKSEALEIFKDMGFDKALGEDTSKAIVDLIANTNHLLPNTKPSTDVSTDVSTDAFIPYFRLARFLTNFLSELIPDDEMERMLTEDFFFSLDRDADGALSIEELAEGFGKIFIFSSSQMAVNLGKNVTKEQFKNVLVKPMYTLMLAGNGDVITYDHYRRFMELRIALREHIKENAGSSYENRVLIASKNQGSAFNQESLDYTKNIQEKPDFLTQLDILLRRNFYVFMKDPRGLRMSMVQGTVIPLVIGLLYFDQDRTQENYNNVAACCFMMLMFSGMLPITQTVIAFPLEKAIIMREYTNGCYDALPFYISKCIFLSISRGYVAFLIGFAGYFMAGIHPTGITFSNMCGFFSVTLMMTIWSSISGLTLGFLAETPETATGTAMPLVLVNVMFAGFLISSGNIPVYFIWAYYLSMMHYCLSAVMVNTFEDYHFKGCDEGYDPDEEECPFGSDGTGKDVLEAMDIQFDTYWPNMYVAMVYACLTVLGGYMMLHSRFKISLVIKANIDAEEEPTETGWLEKFRQDFKAVLYIFRKDKKEEPMANEPIVEETQEGLIRRRTTCTDLTRAMGAGDAVKADSAADRFGARKRSMPVGSSVRRSTFHVIRKRPTFAEANPVDPNGQQELQGLFAH